MIKDRRRLVAGAAALALAGTAGVVAVTRNHDGDQIAGSGAAAAAVATPTPDGTQQAIRQRIDLVLSARASAVLKGDLAGFLAAVDPRQPALVARQRLLFTNLRKFGFASLHYFVGDEHAAPAIVAKHGPSTIATRVMMRYQLAGLDSRPVQTDLGYAFVRRGTQWILVEDSAIDDTLSDDGHQQPWDFQEVAVIRRGPLAVVVDKREAVLGDRIARVSETAMKAVRRHWPRPWNGAVLVVAMSEPKVMATVWKTGAGDTRTIAAKAVSLYDGEPLGVRAARPVGSRIVVNPEVRTKLPEDLLVHELTHVATTPLGDHTPDWLIEGVAEYVRTRSIEDDPHWTIDPYRRTVRTKYLPSMKVLPTQQEFYRNGDRSYGQSWWAVGYLVAKYGVKGMADLYADLAAHDTSPAAYSDIVERHTGNTPQQLTVAVKNFKG